MEENLSYHGRMKVPKWVWITAAVIGGLYMADGCMGAVGIGTDPDQEARDDRAQDAFNESVDNLGGANVSYD